MVLIGVKWKTKANRLPDMIKTAKELNGKKVQVGVFGEKAWLAGIHEYGCVITPSKKFLTVPCNPKAKGKKAGDFNDLFFMESDEGTKFLARPKGKDGIEVMFVLMTKVVIPERAFLRTGFDNNANKVLKNQEKLLGKSLDGTLSVETYLSKLGKQLASAIKTDARDLSDPPNVWTTTTTKKSSNPLIDTGEMIRGITYQVEG